jgi:hypothetical protein
LQARLADTVQLHQPLTDLGGPVGVERIGGHHVEHLVRQVA